MKRRQEGLNDVLIAGVMTDAIYEYDAVVAVRGKQRPDVYRLWTSKPWEFICMYYNFVVSQQKNKKVMQVYLRFQQWRAGEPEEVVSIFGKENVRLFVWDDQREALGLARELGVAMYIPKPQGNIVDIANRVGIQVVSLEWN